MSNFSQQVFIISLVLTLLVGSLGGALLRRTEQEKWLLRYCIIATSVHLLWLGWPIIPSAATNFARLVFGLWLGIVLVAAATILVFAIAFIVMRAYGARLSKHMPAIYVGMCLLCAGALYLGGASLRIREETVFVADLDRRLEGLRVANLGDVHIDRFIAPTDLAAAVQAIADRQVDVLAVTGDLIDDSRLIEPTLNALDNPGIPAIVAVNGNHEKIGNLAAVVDAYKRRHDRIKLLVDSSTTIFRSGARAHFIGVDYPMNTAGGHMLSPAAQERMMLRQAAAAFPKADAGELVIALSHHPEFFPVAAARGAQLTLSSHTHGGQVKAFGYPLFGAYDYMSGLYEMNRKHLDVSAGFGHWVPLRFNVPREIVIVTLRRTARDVRSKPNPAPVSVSGVRARRVHASSALAQAQQAT